MKISTVIWIAVGIVILVALAITFWPGEKEQEVQKVEGTEIWIDAKLADSTDFAFPKFKVSKDSIIAIVNELNRIQGDSSLGVSFYPDPLPSRIVRWKSDVNIDSLASFAPDSVQQVEPEPSSSDPDPSAKKLPVIKLIIAGVVLLALLILVVLWLIRRRRRRARGLPTGVNFDWDAYGRWVGIAAAKVMNFLTFPRLLIIFGILFILSILIFKSWMIFWGSWIALLITGLIKLIVSVTGNLSKAVLIIFPGGILLICITWWWLHFIN